MRGYCPNCGEFIEGLCDDQPGLNQQQKAILELAEKIKKLEKQMKRILSQKAQ